MNPSHPRDWGPLFETIPQGIVVVDEAGRFIDANRYASRIFEWEPEAFLALDFRDPRWRLWGADRRPLPPEECPIHLALQTRCPLHQHVLGLLEGEGDEILWLEISVGMLPEGGGVFTFRDISERFQRESLLGSRARIMACATRNTPEGVLRVSLDEAELLTDSRIGFFHFVDADQQSLSLQAWSTRTVSEFCTAEGQGFHYPIAEAGVWVDCLREGRPVIHNDYASLTHRKGLPPGHAVLTRELVVPVIREGHTMAILGVGNKPFAYGSRDVETASQLAELAWDCVAKR